MATATTSAALAIPAGLADGRAAAAAAPLSAGLPVLPLSPPIVRMNLSKTTSYCHKIARNVVAMATGEAMVIGDARATGEAPDEVVTETPEIVKTIQDAWDKIEDKYAVSSLAVAGVIALWVSTGMISAIDRLPLVPGVLELVGIGYSGWFAYRNLVFKPDREALIAKLKSTYGEIIGSN